MKSETGTEIRELTAEEKEAVTGGLFSFITRLWNSQPVELECVQDPLGHGTTIGNCMIV
jgi:hypothetical protein